MRTSLHVTLIGVLFISNAYLLFQHFTDPSQEIVFVESSKLLNGYQGMLDARKVYKQKAIVWQANIDTLVNEIQNDLKKFEKEMARMTVKERDLTRQLLQNKQQQLADYQKATQENAANEDGKMTKLVIDEVNQYIKDYGRKKGLRIILAATEYGNIAYAEEGIDITEEILEGLNKKYKGL